MAKVWKAGDYIPIDYLNALESEVEKLRKEVGKNVGKNKCDSCKGKGSA